MIKRKEFIEEQIKNGVNESTARYHWNRYKNGKTYTPRPRRGLTGEYLEKLGVMIGIEARNFDDVPVMWSVWQYKNVDNGCHKQGVQRPIAPMKSGNYKNTDCKYHLYTWFIDENGKQRSVSLASLIMVCYRGKDIPAGYVVDHIDNDPFNNDPRNLQIISISDNVKKDHKGHNQYNYVK